MMQTGRAVTDGRGPRRRFGQRSPAFAPSPPGPPDFSEPSGNFPHPFTSNLMSSLSGTQSGPDTELHPDRPDADPETASAAGAAAAVARGVRPDVALLHKAQ